MGWSGEYGERFIEFGEVDRGGWGRRFLWEGLDLGCCEGVELGFESIDSILYNAHLKESDEIGKGVLMAGGIDARSPSSSRIFQSYVQIDLSITQLT